MSNQKSETPKKAQTTIVRDPKIMQGTPVFRGTRIPVELVAEMILQGASIEEILQGYPALNQGMIKSALMFMRRTPPREFSSCRPWAKRKPIRITWYRAEQK